MSCLCFSKIPYQPDNAFWNGRREVTKFNGVSSAKWSPLFVSREGQHVHTRGSIYWKADIRKICKNTWPGRWRAELEQQEKVRNNHTNHLRNEKIKNNNNKLDKKIYYCVWVEWVHQTLHKGAGFVTMIYIYSRHYIVRNS